MIATILIALAAYLFLWRGGYEKPWTSPKTGTRRQHRAAYAEKGFRI